MLGKGRRSIGWQGDLVVYPNLNFHLSCWKRGTSTNCCSDAFLTSWWPWGDGLFAILFTVGYCELLELGAWNVKPLKDTFASRHVHHKYLIRLFFIYLGSIHCSAVAREQLHLRLMLNLCSSSGCSLLCIPGVRCCGHIPVVLREVLPHWHRGSLAISLTGWGGRSVPWLLHVIHNSTCQCSR